MADRDTRKWSSKRAMHSLGYDGRRSVLSYHQWEIGATFPYYGWDTFHEDVRYECWSPNTPVPAIYPGTPPVNLRRSPPLDIPRFDGSLGRFDPLYTPQTWNSDNAHWAFVPNRAFRSSQSGIGSSPPEWTSLTFRWEPAAPPSETHGCVTASFHSALVKRAELLEERRKRMCARLPPAHLTRVSAVSSYPSPSDLRPLLSPREWGDQVDLYACIQRGLMLKNAWLEMMSRLEKSKWTWQTPPFPNGRVPSANQNWTGVWLNSAPEGLGKWLMNQGVPVYFIHRYVPRFDLNPERRQKFVVPDWGIPPWKYKGTVIKPPPPNEYDDLGRRQGALSARDVAELPEGKKDAETDYLQRNRSSSWSQGYQRPTGDLCIPTSKFYSIGGPALPSPPPMPAHRRVLPTPNFVPLGDSRPGSPAGTEVDEDGPVPPVRRHNDGAIIWEDTVEVASDRERWVRPPPIAQWNQRSTARFEETTIEDERFDPEREYMVYRGKGYQVDADDIWYDRENARILYFSSPLFEVPGLVEPSSSKWGCPVPSHDWRECGPHYSRAAPSKWMYRKQKPDPGDAGRRQAPPLPEHLRLLAGTAPPAVQYSDDEEDEEEIGIPGTTLMTVDPSSFDANPDSSMSVLGSGEAWDDFYQTFLNPSPSILSASHDLIDVDADPELNFGTPSVAARSLSPLAVPSDGPAPERGDRSTSESNRMRTSTSPAPDVSQDASGLSDPMVVSPLASEREESISLGSSLTPPSAPVPPPAWVRLFGFHVKVAREDVDRTIQNAPLSLPRPSRIAYSEGQPFCAYTEQASETEAREVVRWWDNNKGGARIIVCESPPPGLEAYPLKTGLPLDPWNALLRLPEPPSPAMTRSSLSSTSSRRRPRSPDQGPSRQVRPDRRPSPQLSDRGSRNARSTPFPALNDPWQPDPAADWGRPPAGKGKNREESGIWPQDTPWRTGAWQSGQDSLDSSRSTDSDRWSSSAPGSSVSSTRRLPVVPERTGRTLESRIGSSMGSRERDGPSLLLRLGSGPLQGSPPELLRRMNLGRSPSPDRRQERRQGPPPPRHEQPSLEQGRRQWTHNPPPPSGSNRKERREALQDDTKPRRRRRRRRSRSVALEPAASSSSAPALPPMAPVPSQPMGPPTLPPPVYAWPQPYAMPPPPTPGTSPPAGPPPSFPPMYPYPYMMPPYMPPGYPMMPPPAAPATSNPPTTSTTAQAASTAPTPSPQAGPPTGYPNPAPYFYQWPGYPMYPPGSQPPQPPPPPPPGSS